MQQLKYQLDLVICHTKFKRKENQSRELANQVNHQLFVIRIEK